MEHGWWCLKATVGGGFDVTLATRESEPQIVNFPFGRLYFIGNLDGKNSVDLAGHELSKQFERSIVVRQIIAVSHPKLTGT